MVDRIAYDEFSMFRENADEFGLPWDGPPLVHRVRVELDDGRHLSALVWGDASPEVVLVHGGAQNAHTWDTVALALDLPLVAVDMPGHGHSGPPADGSVDPWSNAVDVAAAVRALAPDAGTIVGMSLGGLTTMVMAETDPDLVRRLVLVDITPGVNHDKARAIAAFVNGPKTFDSFEALLERTIEHNPTRSVSSLRRGILHNAEQLDDGSWVWRHARHRVFADEHTRRDYSSLWDSLERSAAPLMLVRGTREQSVIDDADEAELRRRRPDARIEHVDAGHSVQGDAPLELARLIDEFAAGD